MKKLIIRTGASALAFAPVLALAQNLGSNGFMGLLDSANLLITRLIPLIIALTVLVFLWGVFKYVWANDPEGRKAATGFMVWGVVALFVMVTVWGLVNILIRTFGLNTNPPPPPQIPTTFTR